MGDAEINIHVLDAAYKPFPTFEEWASKTSVDLVRWKRYLASLEARTHELSPDILARARDIAKRAAAIDTGAIEGLYEVDRGFTFTVALEAAAWEALLARKGEQVRPLFEAQLHAYDYVLDLATKAEPISEASIRGLHVEVCRAQETYDVVTAVGPQKQPLPKGQYKALSNHVRTRKGTNHSYAPVDMTPPEMARLVGEMRSPAFLAAHPVVQAAYVHYGLVAVHPFADGNGRVARALASTFTYQAISMPIVILSEHKLSYLEALEGTDNGDFQTFVDFMLARSLDTISLVDESVRSALVPKSQVSLSAIAGLFVTKGGYSHEQIDQVGLKFLAAAASEITRQSATFDQKKVKLTINDLAGNYPVPSGYRQPLTGGRSINFSFNTPAPAAAAVGRRYVLLLPRDAAGEDDIQFRYEENARVVDTFGARVDELVPAMSAVLEIKLRMFVERIIGEMLAVLKTRAEAEWRTRTR
jgi:Fic family protein